jgi:cellulose biosynthesis protein BcsQ
MRKTRNLERSGGVSSPRLKAAASAPQNMVSRTRLTRGIQALLPKLASGVPVLPEIRQSVKVAEAPGEYLPILQYRRQHPASEDYRNAARHILASLNGSGRW